MIQLIEPYGFKSYFELYEDLKQRGFAGESKIAFTTDRPVRMKNRSTGVTTTRKDTDDLVLDMDYIKSRAFDEVYNQLPAPAFMQVLKFFILVDARDPEKANVIVKQLDALPLRDRAKY